MPTQKICLKWNSFQANILTSFENLWEEEGFVDVTLASDGQCIRAHKVILSACSPFFKKIFESNPCQHPVIILQDVHFSEVESLLNFVYKGEVHIDEENLPALLRAAETLQIRGLSGASDQLKQKTTVLKKSNVDGAPPLKRMRQILKPPRSPGQSPAPPSNPRLLQLATPATEHAYTQPYKSTFLTKEEFLEHAGSPPSTLLPPRPQHLPTPPGEHSQTRPYELTFATKQELLDHEPASPDQHLEEAYDESNDDSMDLMAKHMAMETEQLNELSNEAQVSAFVAGATYDTFIEFEKAYNEWADAGHHPMSICQSRISALGSNSQAHPYNLIKYRCKHHGKPRKRGNNIRPKQHYYGQECPVFVSVKFLMRRNKYVVKQIVSEHNHPVSADLRSQYPDKRIPKGKDMEAIVQLIHDNANVKLIKTIAEKKFGTLLRRHDVHNARQRVKKKARVEASQELFEADELNIPGEPLYCIEVETV